MKNSISLVLFLFSAIMVAQDWQPTYAEALNCAMEKDKPLLVVFSGSDWCAPCIKLDKSIWQTEDFISYSKEHYVMYRADFPRKKGNKLSPELTFQNSKLAEKYNPKGYFPLVVLLDSDETILGMTGYKKATPSEYINLLNTFIK